MEILNDRKGQRVDGDKTICEVHRQLADMIMIRLKDQPAALDEIMPVLNDAYKMGIRLVLSLIEKKIELPEWEKNNFDKDMILLKERIMLKNELNEIGCCL